MEKMVIIEWTEYERGWGCRPDGCSIHADAQSAQSYVNAEYAKRDRNYVPDEYSNPTDVNFMFVNDPALIEKVKVAWAEGRPLWLSNQDIYKYRKDESVIISKDKPQVRI